MKLKSIRKRNFLGSAKGLALLTMFYLVFMVLGVTNILAESADSTPGTGSHDTSHVDEHITDHEPGDDDHLVTPPDFRPKPVMDHPPILYGDMNGDGVSEMVIYREKPGEDNVRLTILFFTNPPAEAVDGAINILLENRRITFLQPSFGDVSGDGNNDLIFFTQARVPHEDRTSWLRIRFAVEAIDFHGATVTEFPQFVKVDPATGNISLSTTPDVAVPVE